MALAEHFAKKYADANGIADRDRSRPRRERRLLTHRWPGNVRELENAMHRAVLLATGAGDRGVAIRLPDGAPMPTPGAETARAAVDRRRDAAAPSSARPSPPSSSS